MRTSEANMNSAGVIIYKKVLQEVCEKFNGVGAFVKERIEELCNEKKIISERGNLLDL